MEQKIGGSELILNPDGSIYHLHLLPHQLAETVITVGDPDRVSEVSKHFDRIEHTIQHREFVTHTGYLNNKHLTVISTGIGTDNIDIVLNELDALVNIDFESRTVKPTLKSLEIIRIGTSGSIQKEIPIDCILMAEMAIGLDGLMCFYKEKNSIQETIYLEAFKLYLKKYFTGITPYISTASESLLKRFEPSFKKGVTVTATGFYGPQGRCLRTENEVPNLIQIFNQFKHTHFGLTNLEMETAGIYALGNHLGHHCLSINAILANRITQEFSQNPSQIVEKMIEQVLEILTIK